MALKSIICGIVHHACRSLAHHCPTKVFRVLNSHQGQSAYSGFVAELIIYIKKNLKLMGFHHMHCCTDKVALCITQADDQMIEIYRVIEQMTLKSIICGIVHHASRTRDHSLEF